MRSSWGKLLKLTRKRPSAKQDEWPFKYVASDRQTQRTRKMVCACSRQDLSTHIPIMCPRDARFRVRLKTRDIGGEARQCIPDSCALAY